MRAHTPPAIFFTFSPRIECFCFINTLGSRELVHGILECVVVLPWWGHDTRACAAWRGAMLSLVRAVRPYARRQMGRISQGYYYHHVTVKTGCRETVKYGKASAWRPAWLHRPSSRDELRAPRVPNTSELATHRERWLVCMRTCKVRGGTSKQRGEQGECWVCSSLLSPLP